MANDISGRQWVLDTVGAAWNHEVKITGIQYVEYAVATEPFVLKDRTGRVIWTGVGDNDFTPVTMPMGLGWVEGLTVDTLTAPGKFIVSVA